MEFNRLYFYTAIIKNWLPLLEKDEFKMVIINSLKYLVNLQKIRVYSYVIMLNHVHLIWELLENNGKEPPHASFMKFTSHHFLKLMRQQDPIGLKKYDSTTKTRRYQLWQRNSRATVLYTPDIIYQNNTYPSDTRSSIYDINQSPRTFMDGLSDYNYLESHIKNYQVINRSLEKPKFDIDLIITQESNSRANIEVTITALDTLYEQIILNIFPVETGIYNSAEITLPAGIDSLRNVVKDMRPAGGKPYNQYWTPGMSETFTTHWDMNELLNGNRIYDNNRLGIIAFVQNDENEVAKEVYQAIFAKLPVLDRTVITGIQDELNVKKFENATIYPNPAQNYFNVSLSDQLTMDLEWSILDQRGVELSSGTFISGESMFEIDTKSLSNGLYMFIVSGGKDFKYFRKVVVQR